jgi:hypothetical protein
MVPLYAARVSDLQPGDFVTVECGACEHVAMLPAAYLLKLRLRAKPV